MVDIIICSKNRACQLDLLLQSIERYCTGVSSITVIYYWTNDLYNAAYKKLIQDEPKVTWRPQGDFRNSFSTVLENCKHQHVLFISDDCVFIRKTDLKECTNYYALAQSFSLRLGMGMNYCLPAQLNMQEPQYEQCDDNTIMWKWVDGDPRVCYYYPFPFDSNVYRRKEIIKILAVAEYKNPKTIEERLNENRNYDKPYMKAFVKPRLICVSNNETGQGSNLPCGDQSTEYLNKQFMEGKRILLSDFNEIEVEQCHIIQPYTLVRM